MNERLHDLLADASHLDNEPLPEEAWDIEAEIEELEEDIRRYLDLIGYEETEELWDMERKQRTLIYGDDREDFTIDFDANLTYFVGDDGKPLATSPGPQLSPSPDSVEIPF